MTEKKIKGRMTPADAFIVQPCTLEEADELQKEGYAILLWPGTDGHGAVVAKQKVYEDVAGPEPDPAVPEQVTYYSLASLRKDQGPHYMGLIGWGGRHETSRMITEVAQHGMRLRDAAGDDATLENYLDAYYPLTILPPRPVEHTPHGELVAAIAEDRRLPVSMGATTPRPLASSRPELAEVPPASTDIPAVKEALRTGDTDKLVVGVVPAEQTGEEFDEPSLETMAARENMHTEVKDAEVQRAEARAADIVEKNRKDQPTYVLTNVHPTGYTVWGEDFYGRTILHLLEAPVTPTRFHATVRTEVSLGNRTVVADVRRSGWLRTLSRLASTDTGRAALESAQPDQWPCLIPRPVADGLFLDLDAPVRIVINVVPERDAAGGNAGYTDEEEDRAEVNDRVREVIKGWYSALLPPVAAEAVKRGIVHKIAPKGALP